MNRYQIRPNNIAVGRGEDEITAMALGSGIAVCLYDEETRTGGMIYTLFPDSNGVRINAEEEKLRYVDTAMEVLEQAVLKAGAKRERLWAKLIGGARIFHFTNGREQENIGKQNIEAAREWLREHEIVIKAEDTGNSFGRTVHFFLSDGDAEIELVNKYKYNL